jgi:hypothetical protein
VAGDYANYATEHIHSLLLRLILRGLYITKRAINGDEYHKVHDFWGYDIGVGQSPLVGL